MDRLAEFKLCENYTTVQFNTENVQGNKVKYSDRSNSAADWSISLKFGAEFHQVTGDTPQVFKVKGYGHRIRGQGQKSVT